jgi:glycosyltransferase involved in cell wall biosynthesis
MKISFTGAPEWMDRNVGYGEASTHIINTFEDMGIECLIKSRDPKIGISFIQPDQYRFGKNQYKIGYTPWESTDIFPSWKKPLNDLIDELWTTSPWCAEIFKKHTDKPVFVYEHGVQDNWIPKKREINPSRPFRFLHIGEPAFRKDAQMVVDAFVSLYGNNPNYELILKCSNLNTTRIFDKKDGHVKGSPSTFYPNIKIIESFLSVEQMDGLYDLCDVFVYPSWGEGFGFNPLQAMAKGIPTICTEGWATYAKYITMPLNSKWWKSPWPTTHPGLLLKPNYNELKYFMEDVVTDYEYYSAVSYNNAFLIHKDYNWKKVSKPAVERLKKIEKEYF